MKLSAKHAQITGIIAEDIASGKFGELGRLPSEVALAKRFGVSRPTICRAIQSLQRQGLITRRPGFAAYACKEAAIGQTLPAPDAQIGIIVQSLLPVEIFEAISAELATFARAQQFGFTWSVGETPSREVRMTIQEAENLCEAFIRRKVAGVFFVPLEHHEASHAANQRIVDRLRQAGIPIVLLDRDIVPFPSRSGFDVVEVNNQMGAYQLADHLLKLGMRRLAFAQRPLTAGTVNARINGVRMALLDHGIETRNLVFNGDLTDTKAVRAWLFGLRPEAVICTNDLLASELMDTSKRMGLRIPEDLRIVGFDDMNFAAKLRVPLTTVRQPVREIAVTAFHALKERMSNPGLPARNLVTTPTLIVRESCGAYLGRLPAAR